MKSVLLICDSFVPAFAPRMGYLCKYLTDYGWQISVLTEEHSSVGCNVLDKMPETQCLSYYKRGTKIEWLFKSVADILFEAKDKALYKLYQKTYNNKKFDLVLCSTFMQFPLSTASRIASELKVPLVVDVRDVIEQYVHYEFAKHKIYSLPWLNDRLHDIRKLFIVKRRNAILKKADAITTISTWHKNLLSAFNDNVTIIYNGYDPELFYPEKLATERFVICYTGRIIGTDMQDPTLLFESLKKMNDSNIINPETLVVRWYVDDASANIIKQFANKYRVKSYMDIKTYIPVSEIPSVLKSSSIILVLTNKQTVYGPKGIMTTKFFEALATCKPILCVRSDEAGLSSIIKETNCGIAATTTNEVCDFIDKWQEYWKTNSYTIIEQDSDKISVYSRKLQAKQFSDLFDKLIKNV